MDNILACLEAITDNLSVGEIQLNQVDYIPSTLRCSVFASRQATYIILRAGLPVAIFAIDSHLRIKYWLA